MVCNGMDILRQLNFLSKEGVLVVIDPDESLVLAVVDEQDELVPGHEFGLRLH